MIKSSILSFENKIYDPKSILNIIKTMKHPIVFTNGCFDILHIGHVAYLDQAKSLGKSLIVAINSDASIKRLKGENRPINVLKDRLRLIASLQSVDIVTWFNDDTPINLIKTIKPDILVKGGDWNYHDIVGSKEMLSIKNKVYSIPIIYNTSTTCIIEKIRNANDKK